MSFTEAEWKVMKLVWELGPCQAKDIYTLAQNRYGWARGTTKSLIFRVYSKGYLHTKQVGNKYIYSPNADLLDEAYSQTGEILEGVFDEVAGDLACRLLKKGKLSDKTIQELRAIVEKLKKKEKEKKKHR